MVGDGSAMYILQSLWTQAREGLDVTTIVFANCTYQILKGEFAGVDAENLAARRSPCSIWITPALDCVLCKGQAYRPARSRRRMSSIKRLLKR